MKAAFVLTAICSFASVAVDWPQYRADAARSGYAAEELPADLHARWTFEPRHGPAPAWQGTDTRMAFDYAHHAVIAGGRLFFGSSADHKVYALDAETGQERWSFFTAGPVRFAPAVWNGRVLAASDDGCLYCLSAGDGALLWKKRGGPGENRLLGNDRMVSRWPARGGPAVVEEDGRAIVYFAAGIWPSEGIYLYALDAATGDVLWLNDSAGAIDMPQPHPSAEAKSGVSAQGYLAVAGDGLIVPTGRAVPAVFNRDDGTFRCFRLQDYGQTGDTAVVAADTHFFNDGQMFCAADGAKEGVIAFPGVAVTPRHVLWTTKKEVRAVDREHLVVVKDAVDRKGNPIKRKAMNAPAWTFPVPDPDGTALIAAGSMVVYGTREGKVVMADTEAKKVVWTGDVEGVPYGLAVADGRLYVSTDRGLIHCFDGNRKSARKPLRPRRTASPYGRNKKAAATAQAIIETTGVTEGYCLDLGCGDGALAYELARRTDVYVVAIDDDMAAVRSARAKLDAAGFYGNRVTVHHGDLAQTPYADHFADLVVSGRAATEGTEVTRRDEMLRLARPYGGQVCTHEAEALETTVTEAPLGAGVWTHQYADPANTCASGDRLVRPPLRALWFRDTDFEMPSRHGRGPAPLFWRGRLYVEGLNALRAVNAYNGRPLWEFPLPKVLAPYDQEHLVGTAATGSNLCMTDDGVYVRVGSNCLLIDAVTGQQKATFDAPGRWGYLACKDGRLFGSVSNEDHLVYWAYRHSDMSKIFTESSLFFAMDARTGDVQWTFQPEHSIRHNAIAIGDGVVYLIDRPLQYADLLDLEEKKRRGEAMAGKTPPPATLYALDAATGETLWSTSEDIYGTLLAVSIEHDVLLMTQQHTRFKLPSEIGGRMTAFRASDGTRLWDAPTDPQGKASRPLLIGTTIYNEPGAWNLLTGERLDWHLTRSYGCGIVSGCDNVMLYRSATLGYADLNAPAQTVNYGGIRPACWINAIPVGGIVLMPDATARCVCSYLIRAWMALEPVG